MILSRVYNFYECSKNAQLSCLNFLDRSWSSHNFQYGGTLYYVYLPTLVLNYTWSSLFNPILGVLQIPSHLCKRFHHDITYHVICSL
jgi:hypothetical protein